MIRLASGRLFFVADLFDRKKLGPKGDGAFVRTERRRRRDVEDAATAGIVTVGYTTATQAPNGVIHVVTSKNAPALHIELNEAWVIEGGPESAAPPGMIRGQRVLRYNGGGRSGRSST